SKGADQHRYPNENLGDKNRDDQQKKPGTETAPARESRPKSVPHWRPTPEKTPGGCKCQRNEQNGSGSTLRDRPKSRDGSDGSDNACKDPHCNGTTLGTCNFFTKTSFVTGRAEGCSVDIMSTNSAYPLLTLGTLSHSIGLRMSETSHLVYTPSVLSSSGDED